MIGIMESQKSGHLITGNFDLISQQFGNGSVSSITFSSIPQTYKSLQLRVNVLNAAGGSTQCGVQFNSVTTGYYYHGLAATNGNTAYADVFGNVAYIIGSPASAGGLSISYPAVSIIDIIDYTSTSKFKTIKGILGINNNVNVSSTMGAYGGLYPSTTAITSLTYYSTGSNAFSSTSSFALYGVS